MANRRLKSLFYSYNHTPLVFVGVLFVLTFFSGFALTSERVSADTSGVVDLSMEVPAACSLTVTQGAVLTKTINSGDSDTIGTSTIKSVCNDSGGLAVYAVGYTNDSYGNTNLTASDGGNTYDIATNATSGTPSDSEWNMTLTAVAGTYAPTVVTGFDSPSAIPAWYTKVAYRNSLTDAGNGATGANFTAKFDAYISLSQPAGSYTGKVKFVLIHPSIAHNPASSLCYNANGGEGAPECQNGEAGQTAGTYVHTLSSNTPHKFESVFLGWSEDPDATTATYQPGASLAFTKPTILYAVWRQADITNLLSGSSINVKIKNLANNTSNATYNTTDSTVTAFSRADSLPSGFTPSTANTISTSASTTPVYIFKDANDSGHIHYYSQADIIYANANSSRMFQNLRSLATISGLSDLDTSKVTNMSSMFSYAGRNATSWSVGNLSSWDTSKVTNMSSMFAGAGYSATNSFSLNLSGWNTSSVTNMSSMFSYAGYSATSSFSLNLSGWNTSSVTNISFMFESAGYNATNFSLNLSDWDTSKVTTMTNMFSSAGRNATSWSVTIPSTNGGDPGINNSATRLYGSTSSKYAAPPSDRTFTIQSN